MPRPRLPQILRNTAFWFFATEPSRSAESVARELASISPEAPSARAVRSWRSEFDELKEPVQRGFGAFHWPEAFETGDLPWEAANVVLRAVRVADGGLLRSVNWAQWVWRLHCASPDMPEEVLGALAGWLSSRGAASSEASGARRAAETFLLSGGWHLAPDGSGDEEYVILVDEKGGGRDDVLARIAEAVEYLAAHGLIVEQSPRDVSADIVLRGGRRSVGGPASGPHVG